MLSNIFSFLKNSMAIHSIYINVYTFYKFLLLFNELYHKLIILIGIMYNYTCMEIN